MLSATVWPSSYASNARTIGRSARRLRQHGDGVLVVLRDHHNGALPDEDTFTFHGFRCVEVEGWPGGIDAITEKNLTAVVVSSDLRRTGHFKSSDALLNQLHDNVVWGMRGNFLDVPTDCPQRDERLGWTGDIAAFAPTAAYLSGSSRMRV
ncbi:hypothetical protein IV500_20655 [Paeniglutamicibacter antarcticus]|uniref:alpha-L-rhamnosidase n=1 Tax=Arthrobacter terrae TaxID=2935737 RepID=A0A931CUT1_9MICC|nr:hypothetical protein [Arthrobacter terrae]